MSIVEVTRLLVNVGLPQNEECFSLKSNHM